MVNKKSLNIDDNSDNMFDIIVQLHFGIEMRKISEFKPKIRNKFIFLLYFFLNK